MKILSFILGTLLLTTQALGARHCKSERYRTYADQIASLSPSGDLDLLDFEMFPGGSIVGGYEYEVEPAYTKGLYSRTDRWLIHTQAVPGDSINLSEGFDISFSGGVKNQTEATFIRFFNEPCQAMLSNPYAPTRMPLLSRIAIGPKFNVGDYFLFRGSVGFVASAELLSLLGSPLWGATLGGSYLLEGFYQLHIVRLDEKHIRLKVVAHRSQGFGASFGLGFRGDFEVFKISQIDRQLEKFVNTTPVKMSASYGHNKVFIVDYILDLTDKKVSDAFDAVLRKVKFFKNIEHARPFKKEKNLEANLLLDLSPLEDIYRQDQTAQNLGRLKRNLKATSEQDTYGFGVNAGNKILGFSMGRSRSSANMSIKLPDDTAERYLLRSWDKSWESRFLYSWYRYKEEEGLSALFKADDQFQVIAPVNLVKHMKQKKNRFSYGNLLGLKKNLLKALPIEIYREIPWYNWQQGTKEKFMNFGLRYELLMAPESIVEAPYLEPKEVKIFFRDHLLSKGLTPSDYFVEQQLPDQDPVTAEEQFEASLSRMAKLLSKVLDPRIPMVQRIDLITKLRRNELFIETGISFLMALRPDKMKEWYHLDLDISSNEAEIDYSYGDSELSSLYKKILTIKAALDDEALDLLREAESISLPVPAAG